MKKILKIAIFSFLKFCQLCFYQILFKLVYSWKSYCESKTVNFFYFFIYRLLIMQALLCAL